MKAPAQLGNSRPSKVAVRPGDWRDEALRRRAEKRRHADGGAWDEVHGVERRSRSCVPLPSPGDREYVAKAVKERDAKRVLRLQAAETLQARNWDWFGPRKDSVTGLWSKAPRIGTCGRPLGGAVTIALAAVDDQGRPASVESDLSTLSPRAQFHGLETCGNPNACLRCGAKIRGRRAADIGRVLRAHLAGGGYATFLTLTFSHAGSEDAADVIDDAMTAWSKLLQARAWRRLKQSLGVVGFIRTTEITHGDVNGWHPHHHVALLTSQPVMHDDYDGGTLEELRLDVHDLWVAQVHKLARRVHPEIGVTAVPIQDDNGIGAYVSKIELELVRSDLKTGRQGSRSHWQVGVDAATTGEPRDVVLWHSYVQATVIDRSHRYFSTSKRLWDQFGIKDSTDDEIAAEQLEATPVAELAPDLYRQAAKTRRQTLTEIRTLVEAGGGPDVVAAVLSRRLRHDVQVIEGIDGSPPTLRFTKGTRWNR